MFQPEISKEEIRELPLRSYNGPIEVIDDKHKLKEITEKISGESFVGFDTETKPNFRKGRRNNVALMQLATEDSVYIIKLQKTGFTNEITMLMESSYFKKIGVGLKDDMRALQYSNPFEPDGLIHLNEYVKGFGIKNESLRKLTAIILGFRISKSYQLSNWEEPNLSDGQLTYAATDAWVSREMYIRLSNLGLSDQT